MRRVPSSALAPVIGPLIRQRFPDGGIEAVSIKAGVDEALVRRIISGEKDSCEFDTADKILCALGSPMAWHSPELEHVYQSINLGWKKCDLPSCGRMHPALARNRRPQWYCSKNCCRLAHKVRNGQANGNRFVARNRCLRGHKMEGDNVVLNRLADGTIRRQCKECKRITALKASRKYQAKKKAERLLAVAA